MQVLSDKEMIAVEKDVNSIPSVKLQPVIMKCQKCQKSDFHEILLFNEHVLKCYNNNKNNVEFKCNKCENSIWNSAEVLHFHLYSQHQVHDVVCEFCGQILKDIYYLKNHIDHVHRKVKNFQCDQCNVRFSRKQQLVTHIEKAHMNINKYKCHLCDFKTNLSKNRLETHIKIKHMKNSTFECRHCTFVTTIYKRLRTHVTKIHAPLKQKPKIVID